MNVPEYVDRVRVCEPIKVFISNALSLGYKIKSMELQDYHFDTLRFVIESDENTISSPVLNPGIFQPVPNTFVCNCHWSKVEIQ
jgi:hypothetical protein